MKTRYEFVLPNHYISHAITLSGDHDEEAARVIVWALREALFLAKGAPVEVRCFTVDM